MPTEADTCRKFVVPKLQAAGWDNEPHSIAEQRSITDGRIIPVGKGFIRKPPKRVDYLLRYTRDFPLAVVEAKAAYKSAADGLQQAKTYAEMLELKFAYATNGREIIEYNYSTGLEVLRSDFPMPAELWNRYRHANGLSDDTAAGRLLTPFNHTVDKGERYYQQIAVNRTVEDTRPAAQSQASGHVSSKNAAVIDSASGGVQAAFTPCAVSASLRANQASTDACSASSRAADATSAAAAA
jgi:type I restriction enzyme, R subunit